MFDLERNLLIAEAMANDLKPYLLSEALYWPISHHGASYPLPKGTLGGLLIRLHQLNCLADRLLPEQYQRLREAENKTHDQIKQWIVQAEAKAVREIKARLRGWGEYLSECEQNPLQYQDEYRTQVEGRTIPEFLIGVAGKLFDGQGITRQLVLLDKRLQNISQEGPFVWDDALIPAFPQKSYWWLYVRLKKPEGG